MRWVKIIFYGALVVLTLGIGVIFLTLTKKTEAALTAYVPESAVVVVQVSRKELFNVNHEALLRSQLLKWRRDVQSYWTLLEQQSSLTIDRIIWFVTPFETSFKGGVLIHTPAVVSPQRSRELERMAFSDFAWFDPTETMQLRMMGPHVGLLADERLSLRATHNSRGNSDAVSVYVAPEFKRELFNRFKINEFVPWIASALNDTEALSLVADSVGPFLRVQWIDYTPAKTVSPNPVLRVPAHFDLFVHGNKSFLSGAINNPVTNRLTDFVNLLHNRYDMTSDQIESYLQDVLAFVTVGDQWLLMSTHKDVMLDFGSQLSSWFQPKVATSTLPDGTSYRKLVKQVWQPNPGVLHGQEVASWSLVSTTTPLSPELQKLENQYKIYFAAWGDRSYLTNSEELLILQLPSAGAPIITDSFDVRLCLSGIRHDDSVRELIVANAVQAQNTRRLLLADLQQGLQSLYVYCF